MEAQCWGTPSDTLLAILGRRSKPTSPFLYLVGMSFTSILSSTVSILQNDDDVTGDAAVSQEIQRLVKEE
jgi:hypothetical protein